MPPTFFLPFLKTRLNHIRPAAVFGLNIKNGDVFAMNYNEEIPLVNLLRNMLWFHQFHYLESEWEVNFSCVEHPWCSIIFSMPVHIYANNYNNSKYCRSSLFEAIVLKKQKSENETKPYWAIERNRNEIVLEIQLTFNDNFHSIWWIYSNYKSWNCLRLS